MKKILSILFLLLFVVSVNAQYQKIKFTNTTTTIHIDYEGIHRYQ